MKKLLVVILILVVLGLVFPIANLVVKPRVNPLLSSRQTDETGYAAVAAILEKKCLVCHAPDQELPFYANFPIARDLITRDVKAGTAFINLVDELNPGGNAPVSESALAMIEYSASSGSMPPARFVVLHWDSGLSANEKKVILDWVKGVRAKHYQTPGVAPEFANEAVQPIPLTHAQNMEKVALGDKMFHDVRLSHDNTLSCASCHGLDKGGTDQKQFSTGINNQVGDINSPTVFNSGFQFKQFWDGRAADLQEQADGPVNNPIEMGSNWGEAIPKLQADTEVVAAFAKLYPDGLTSTNVMNAIAVFEHSLITPNSRFDKYLMGDANAITPEEKKGYEEFKEHGCATCHAGKLLGGCSFEKIGLKGDYLGDRGNVIKRDNGRFNVTQKDSDRFRFKVPTLRNLDKTAPYFHDGTQATLLDAVRMMGKYQSPMPLSDQDAELIVKFLLTLTGEYNGKPL